MGTRSLNGLISLLLVSLLVGCGWHLRGQGTGASMGGAQVYLSVQGGPELENRVRSELLASQANLVERQENADIALFVLGERQVREIVGVDRNIDANEYELRYRLSYRVENGEGVELLPASQSSSVRSYEYDADNVQASRAREERLSQELRYDAVRLMLLRVQSLLGATAEPEAE
ncbi:LPS assembly lipoprotein LptE [Alkalilimnicola sp. S0819]|uniref:LPS-assembly lipoprotein LptE n=1 Tax=Alkalilimnicola sp. S0819 TaxID=2613922 RepID=UPI0012627892|nr:LPS assembly lipoprotein LptE [Alkalilimnicola sp. S0819]KAB7628263.1 hypothetical protein F3N43_00710 [Alkalilimnicola sp. S0819]MPQ15157.1 hypothetical protein [Alkalilimnicola sp. S0819]